MRASRAILMHMVIVYVQQASADQILRHIGNAVKDIELRGYFPSNDTYYGRKLDHDSIIDTGWKESQAYRYLFLVPSFISFIGVILNLLCLSAFLKVEKKFWSMYHVLTVAVSAIDLFYTLIICLDNSFSAAIGEFYGIENQEYCTIWSIFGYISTIWSVCLIGCIAHVIKRHLCTKYVTSVKESIYLALGSGIYAVTCSVCIIIPIAKGSSVVRSANYCLARRSLLGVIASIFLGYIPLTWLAYSFYKIYITISESQKMLSLAGLQGKAKYKYFQRVKRLGYFLASIGLCESPLLVVLAYQRFSSRRAPAWISYTVGIISLLYAAILNPTIFLVSNPRLREGVLDELEQIKSCFLCRRIKASKQEARVSPDQGISTQYHNLDLWLKRHTKYHDLFRSYCKSIYAEENILFLDDIQSYYDECNIFSNLFYHGNTCESIVLDKWSQVNLSASRIYYLYIQVSGPRISIDNISSFRFVIV